MIGQTIDRYTLVEKLGSGGMGDVFKGHHASLDQYRAIKVLPPYLSRNRELVERFLREARRCASLSHPNIVRLEHVGEQDGLYYMVMDYVPGPSLREVIDEEGPLAPERGVRIAVQVCRALAHAHESGVIHRDVKPSNILVRGDGQTVLTDFGIARGLQPDEPSLTEAGATVGTPEYMSPEQIRGEAVDGRSDLYSLGVVLYEMFTWELPFSARAKAVVKRQHLEKAPEPPRFYNPELSPALEQVILRALEKDPDRRYGSAQEMGDALEAAVGASVSAADASRRDPTTVVGTTALGWISTKAAGSAPDPPSRPGRSERRTGQSGEETATVVSRVAAEPRGTARSPLLDRLFRDRSRQSMVATGVAGAAALILAFGALQSLGSSATGRFTADKAIDPRTGKEYGIVKAHGAPVFVITRPMGELEPAQRAEKAAERLERLVTGKDGKPLEPEQLVAVNNARGETVLARRLKGQSPKDIDPEDVIVTVDKDTATTYSGTNRTAMALWWRDLLRDQVRLAHGKPPVSTYDTRYGKILDVVYQNVEDERRGGWVAADELQKAFDDLSEPHQKAVDTAWRVVPSRWRGSEKEPEPLKAGVVQVAREAIAASDTQPGFGPQRVIDGDTATAWMSRHGRKHHGHNHWLKIEVPPGSAVSEMQIREGTRQRERYQLRIKQAKATFSDGSTHRLWRRTPDEPLHVSFAPRDTRWVKLEVEQVFRNRDPHESHLYVSEVRLWGP
jgi:hypothetical protein